MPETYHHEDEAIFNPETHHEESDVSVRGVMLFIGIHNAWDTAVWIAAAHPENEGGSDTSE